MLQHAIDWAAILTPSNSENWPTHIDGWAIGETTILVLKSDGELAAYQREWNPVRFYPQQQQELIASIFHIDGIITVVLHDEPIDLNWLEGQPSIPADGDKPTGKQWMHWYDKREREARDDG